MKNKFAVFCLLFLLFNTNLSVFAAVITEQNDYIKAQIESKDLHSRLSQTYTGYEGVIKNIYDKPVTIDNITVWDNANSTVAYLSVKRTAKDAANDVFSTGKNIALQTFGLSLIGSAVVSPFAMLSNRIGNNQAQKEAQKYDKIISAKTTIDPGKEITIRTMALKKYVPYIRITFVNPLTDENMVLELKK